MSDTNLTAAQATRFLVLEVAQIERELNSHNAALYPGCDETAIRLSDDYSALRDPLSNSWADDLCRRLAVVGVHAIARPVAGHTVTSWVSFPDFGLAPGWEDRAVERARREGVLPA